MDGGWMDRVAWVLLGCFAWHAFYSLVYQDIWHLLGIAFYLHIISSSGYLYSVIMILRNLIQPHAIPAAHATLTPISGRNSYLLNNPLSLPVYAIKGASSSIATMPHKAT